MRSAVLLVAALVAGASSVSAATTSAPTVYNPQQQICACVGRRRRARASATRKRTDAPRSQPPKLCPSQMKTVSCTNWQGCMWVDGKCKYDPSCKTKPTRVPTVFVPPTPPTAPHPTTKAPTPAPSKCSPIPGGATGQCYDAKTEAVCGQYSECCEWSATHNPPLCMAKPPAPTLKPTTAAPTVSKAPTAPVVCHAYAGSKTKCVAHGCTWCANCKPAARCV